jgi:hypothetical protein
MDPRQYLVEAVPQRPSARGRYQLVACARLLIACKQETELLLLLLVVTTVYVLPRQMLAEKLMPKTHAKNTQTL